MYDHIREGKEKEKEIIEDEEKDRIRYMIITYVCIYIYIIKYYRKKILYIELVHHNIHKWYIWI